MADIPTTGDVLRIVGNRGVVVGSVARGVRNPKDLDVVVKSRGSAPKNTVFDLCFKLWPEFTDSECPGHVVVTAVPLNVEMFEMKFSTGDVEKDRRAVNYGTACRHSVWKLVEGIVMRVEVRR